MTEKATWTPSLARPRDAPRTRPAYAAQRVNSSITRIPRRARTPFAIALGRTLRRLRRERGLTQADVAGPFSIGFISAVELGLTVPSLPSLGAVLDELGLDYADFFAILKWELNK